MRGALTLICGLAVVTAVFAVALPTASGLTAFPSGTALPAQSRAAEPGKTPHPCKGNSVVWGTDRGETKSDYDPSGIAKGRIVCALDGDDHIYVEGENTIVWAGAGDDAIHAKTHSRGKPKAQIIIGESGEDSIVDRDSVDRFYPDAYPTVRSGRRSGQRTPQRAQAVPAVQPIVRCINNQGFWQMYFEPAPTMRAFNVTGQVDWQYVAWRPVLTRYDNATGAWQFFAKNDWLWDLANEGARVYFSGNTWRRYGNNASPDLDPLAGSPWRVWFNIQDPGSYRIALNYYWYPVAGYDEYHLYEWVAQHSGPYARQQYCDFR